MIPAALDVMFLKRNIGRKEAFFWILSGFWAGVIWGLSSITPDKMPSPGFEFPFAVLAHFILYFVLAGLLYSAFLESKPGMSRLKLMGAVFCICVIYGVIDEIHQSFVPGRTPSAYDVFIDGVGAFSFLFASFLKARLVESRGFSRG